LITVIVPTFGRAGRMAEVAADVHAATINDHEVLFVVEVGDEPSCEQARWLAGEGAAGWTVNRRAHNYAGAINTGAAVAVGGHLFVGADDLHFHPGWDIPALAAMTGPVQVVGTNDLLNPGTLSGTHATHYLVDRSYITGPGGVPGERPGLVLFEGYDHQFTDTEFIAVARARGVFAPCLSSVVEHLHPAAGKAVMDATYQKGHARIWDDEKIFRSREHLWTDSPDPRCLV
jgi:hypothetical protein